MKGSANGIAFACKLTLISPAGDFPKTAEEIKRIIQFSANMTIICISNIHLSQNRSNTTGYQDHIYRLLYCYTVAAPMVESEQKKEATPLQLSSWKLGQPLKGARPPANLGRFRTNPMWTTWNY